MTNRHRLIIIENTAREKTEKRQEGARTLGNKRPGRKTGKVRSWLIDIRKEKDLTQGAVAAAVGISQPSYCAIENGTSDPKKETAKMIGAALGFPWIRLYEDDEEGGVQG